MEMTKVCRGCFTEWEHEKKECPRCGWRPDGKYSKIFNWKLGDVLEKRYLIGNTFYTSGGGDLVVWRIYDNLLGIPCFLLIKDDDSIETLYCIARSLQTENEEEVIVQAIKKIEKRNVLVFSMKNQYMKEASFEKLLECKTDKREEVIQESEQIKNKEQVLAAGAWIDNRYKILKCLGIGGFGITYLCEDIYLHRMVTLKEYFPAEWSERDEDCVVVKQSKLLQAFRYGMQSFMKEIRITAKFIHTPHIATIYDVLKANDTIYMVLKYISGISIGREMRAREYKPFAPLEVAEMIFPVLDALEEIHDKKIIHSDISPGNIMHTEQNDIFLIDMGAAKYNLEFQPLLSAAFLKIDYAAPEQYRTAKEGIPRSEGPWTDIYALGATMYYLLTGCKPPDIFSRLSGKDTDLASALIGKVSIPWIELFQKAMTLESTERIQSVAVLRQEMKKIL